MWQPSRNHLICPDVFPGPPGRWRPKEMLFLHNDLLLSFDPFDRVTEIQMTFNGNEVADLVMAHGMAIITLENSVFTLNLHALKIKCAVQNKSGW